MDRFKPESKMLQLPLLERLAVEVWVGVTISNLCLHPLSAFNGLSINQLSLKYSAESIAARLPGMQARRLLSQTNPN